MSSHTFSLFIKLFYIILFLSREICLTMQKLTRPFDSKATIILKCVTVFESRNEIETRESVWRGKGDGRWRGTESEQHIVSACERKKAKEKRRAAIPSSALSKQIFTYRTTSQFACAKRRTENENNFWLCHTTLSSEGYRGYMLWICTAAFWQQQQRPNIYKIDREAKFSFLSFSLTKKKKKVILLRAAKRQTSNL